MLTIIFKRDGAVKKVKADLKDVKKELKKNLNSIKEGFEDHLQAINENTNEIQGNYEFLCELDSKIDKLNEKIDKIHLLLGEKNNENYDISPLTRKEQEIFLVLYTNNDFMSYSDVAKKTTLTFSLVQAYISNIIAKGIPIVKKYMDNKVFLTLDSAFKNLQARENIVEIHDSVIREIA